MGFGGEIDVSGRLRMLRLHRHLGETDLASSLGIDLDVVRAWEHGNARVRTDYVAPLAGVLGISVEELAGGDSAASMACRKSGEAPEAAIDGADDGSVDAVICSEPTPVRELSLTSRMDVILPFLGRLSIQALHEIVEGSSSSLAAFQLPSTTAQLLLDDVPMSDFAHAAARVAFDSLPADEILRKPLDSIVPPLRLLPGTQVTGEHLPAAILRRVQQHTAGDWTSLGGLYLTDVLEWCSGSVGLAKELLISSICVGFLALGAQADSADGFSLATVTVDGTPSDADLVRAIRTIATWATAIGGSLTVADALLFARQTSMAPREVESASALLATAEARSLATERLAAYDPHAAEDRVFRSLHPRELKVLLDRPLAVGDVPTLSELGDRLGVTRERIRQLESSGLRKLQTALSRPENQPLTALAQQYAGRFGAAAPVLALLDECPGVLGSATIGLSDDAIRARLLLWVAGPYEIAGDWLVRSPHDELIRQTMAVLKEITAGGSVSREDAISCLEQLDIAPPYRQAWLDHVPGFRTIDGQFVAWQGTLVDKAETILRLKGVPMTKDELAEAIGQSSPRAIADRAVGDPRFMRSGMRHIALREWGLEEYSGIEDEMAEEIARQGGEASVDHLVDILTQRFGVSEASVRMYSGGPNFIRTKPGTIRVRTDEDPLPAAPPIEQAKRCYRLEHGWSCRLTVSPDIVRGSGTAVHPGFVGHLGVACLESRSLPSAFGDITVGWSSLQAWIGSLRPVIEALDAHVGDYLFVEYTPLGKLEFTLVQEADLDAVGPAERLALEVGTRLDRWNGDPVKLLAHALGIDRSADQPLHEIRLRLSARGEDDLASLLAESTAVAHDDQSLLDLMEFVLRGPSQ